VSEEGDTMEFRRKKKKKKKTRIRNHNSDVLRREDITGRMEIRNVKIVRKYGRNHNEWIEWNVNRFN